MRVLIVARCKNGNYAPFITEQVDSLQKAGIECQYFGVIKKGYLAELPAFLRAIKEFKPDVIHAHYGLCGLFASLQHKVPVVTTYHGSDINNPKILRLSRIAIKRSSFNIFVSQKNIDKAKPQCHYSLIPCGIDLDNYTKMSEDAARAAIGLNKDKKYILFSGAFDNYVKNYPLAKEAVSLIDDAELIELKGYTRQQVTTLLYAVDAFLMTSFTEGSPQVIKEALACDCPIVSVDVGDVKEVVEESVNSRIVERDPGAIAHQLEMCMSQGHVGNGKEILLRLGMSNQQVANRIISIYQKLQ